MKPVTLSAGLFSAVGVNRQHLAVVEAIESLEARIGALECALKATLETVAQPEETTDDSAETVTFEIDNSEQDEEETFDWRTSKDADALREYALLELGLKIDKRKGLEKTREAIATFLDEVG